MNFLLFVSLFCFVAFVGIFIHDYRVKQGFHLRQDVIICNTDSGSVLLLNNSTLLALDDLL